MSIFVALPILNEPELLPRFMNCLSRQTFSDYTLFACINQPDEWWEMPDRRPVCENNLQSIKYLEICRFTDVIILDKCSPGNGWKGPKHGVGWARKTVMDEISRVAGKDDIILSLDADTIFREDYLRSVSENFRDNPDAVALSVPYFHLPADDTAAYRAILRYEIYMRYYAINLWRIGSPYTFTALGSAMACPVWAYRAVGGMTPKMSGEDFYFLQKLRKYGRMLFHNREKVYPEARFSERVYFGTGPAMIKGDTGDWSSYPVYSVKFFDEIMETYRLFPGFFEKTINTGITGFMKVLCREDDPWRPLRENAKDDRQFVRACHEKFDGLRILQYLKVRQNEEPVPDGSNLRTFLLTYYGSENTADMIAALEDTPLEDQETGMLERIRMFLAEKEEQYQLISVLR
jgi:hypothetical protein